MITIQTEFGEMEVSEQDILKFEKGLYGFESAMEYVLLSEEEDSHILLLQPIQGQVPSFVVIDPYAVYPQYAPQMSQEDKNIFAGRSDDDLRFLLIAAVKENPLESSVNLKSPIVINSKTKQAAQVILDNADYPIRYRFLNDKKKGA